MLLTQKVECIYDTVILRNHQTRQPNVHIKKKTGKKQTKRLTHTWSGKRIINNLDFFRLFCLFQILTTNRKSGGKYTRYYTPVTRKSK